MDRFVIQFRSTDKEWITMAHAVIARLPGFTLSNSFSRADLARNCIVRLIRAKECWLPMRVVRPEGTRVVNLFTAKQIKEMSK